MTEVTASDARKIFKNTATALRTTKEKAPITGADLCVALLIRMTTQTNASGNPDEALNTFRNLPEELQNGIRLGMCAIPPLGAKKPRSKPPSDYNIFSRLRHMLRTMRSPRAVEPELRFHFADVMEAMGNHLSTEEAGSESVAA